MAVAKVLCVVARVPGVVAGMVARVLLCGCLVTCGGYLGGCYGTWGGS